MGNFYEKVRRLLYLQNYFDLTRLLSAQNFGNAIIADYYKKSRKLFYQMFASKQGFMHIGLSENSTYRKDAGYELYQLRLIQETIADSTGVLEVGCGQCANLGVLAPLFPQTQFWGIDLCPNARNVRRIENVKIYQDDYHVISAIEDQSVDVVYAIETVCYSPRKAEALCAVYKKLKENGTFLIFDIFLGKPRKHLEPMDEMYLSIMEHSYYLSSLEPYRAFIQVAEANGFTLCENKNLSPLAMPYLMEIEAREYRYLKAGGSLLKMFLRLCPDAVSRSMPPGIMMRQMVEDGYLQYRFMQFRKAEQ